MAPISNMEGDAFRLKLAKKCIKPIFTGGRKKLSFNVPQFLPNLCRGIIRQVTLYLKVVAITRNLYAMRIYYIIFILIEILI